MEENTTDLTLLYFMASFAFAYVVVQAVLNIISYGFRWRDIAKKEREREASEKAEAFRQLRKRVRAEEIQRLKAEDDSTP